MAVTGHRPAAVSAARSSATGSSNVPVMTTINVQHCIIEHAEWTQCPHGRLALKVEAGGSILSGEVIVRDGGVIRALEGGGFIVEFPCPECAAGTDVAPSPDSGIAPLRPVKTG